MDSKENYSILIVDDDPTVVRILRNILAEFTPLRFATSGKDALLLARKSTPDLMLLDIEMPEMNGFEVCKTFKTDKTLSRVPIIFVSSHESIELETAGLALGAVDFLTKPPHAALVLARIRAQIGTKRLSDTLRNAVTLDFLTGTSNRLHFEKALQSEWLRSRRYGTPLSLVLMELHDFAVSAEAHGEDEAEGVLREMAEALRKAVHRPTDLLARYAAGTFAVLLPETDVAGATIVALRALQFVKDLPDWSTSVITSELTVSVGIGCSAAAFPAGRDSAKAPERTLAKEALMVAAEQAVQKARRAGQFAPSIVHVGVPGSHGGDPRS